MRDSSKLHVALVGGSGYVAGELLRLLIQHPLVAISHVCSREQTGKPVAAVHRQLSGISNLVFSDAAVDLHGVDVAFIVAPHTKAMDIVKRLSTENPQLRIIDLSADFRLSAVEFEKHYHLPHSCRDLLNIAVYGIPELNREAIRSAPLVANPGCFANCVTLSLLPLAYARLIDTAQVSAITGSSGSGAQPNEKTHHPQRAESLSSYQVFTHRHVPEIEQALYQASGNEKHAFVTMVPISGPFSRGIFATSFVKLNDGKRQIADLYTVFTAENVFLRLRNDTPRLVEVRGSNYCDLSVYQQGDQAVIIAALDNLVKGAAGNAVQCMNIMFDINETTGLTQAPLFP